MNEAQTRQDLIDPKLRESGWFDTDGARVRLAFPITKGALIGGGQRSSTLSADYVLQFRNRNVGVIEAKNETFLTLKVLLRPRTMQSACKSVLLMPPMDSRFTA